MIWLCEMSCDRPTRRVPINRSFLTPFPPLIIYNVTQSFLRQVLLQTETLILSGFAAETYLGHGILELYSESVVCNKSPTCSDYLNDKVAGHTHRLFLRYILISFVT